MHSNFNDHCPKNYGKTDLCSCRNTKDEAPRHNKLNVRCPQSYDKHSLCNCVITERMYNKDLELRRAEQLIRETYYAPTAPKEEAMAYDPKDAARDNSAARNLFAAPYGTNDPVGAQINAELSASYRDTLKLGGNQNIDLRQVSNEDLVRMTTKAREELIRRNEASKYLAATIDDWMAERRSISEKLTRLTEQLEHEATERAKLTERLEREAEERRTKEKAQLDLEAEARSIAYFRAETNKAVTKAVEEDETMQRLNRMADKVREELDMRVRVHQKTTTD